MSQLGTGIAKKMMEINHTLYKIITSTKDSILEYRDVKENNLQKMIDFFEVSGCDTIKYFKQTKHKDKLGFVIYENDTIIRYSGGICSGLDSVEMVVILNNNRVYLYSHGYGGKGHILDLEYNHIEFSKTLVIGNVALLQLDLSKVL